MFEIFKEILLYRLLMYFNDRNMEKVVLDCGIGGNYPPLALFYEYKYFTNGIEMDLGKIEKSNNYSKKNGQQLKVG